MHVSMPKSSKGSKGNKLARGQNTDVHPVPQTLRLPLNDRYMCSQGILAKNRRVRISSDVPELMDAVAARALTLNKYSVLPSIEKKPEQEPSLRGVEEKISNLSLSDKLLLKLQCSQEQLDSPIQTTAAFKSPPETSVHSEVLCGSGCPVAFVKSPGTPAVKEALQNPGSLTLAIRTPCGSRIEHHFDPNNTLQSVIGAVEARQGRQYRRCQIETMDMPRRIFTDLNMTLMQCGIVNRSIVCISYVDFAQD